MKSRYLCILILFIGITLPMSAQSSEQFWIDFNPSLERSRTFKYYGDLGYRTKVGNEKFNKIVARSGAEKIFKHFYLTGGIGNFVTWKNEEQDQTDVTVYELRPYQGIGTNWPNTQYIKVNHYVRFEERMTWNTTTADFDFSFRARYKFTFSYAYRTWLENHHNWWKIYLSFELFGASSQSENSIDEQTRLGIGVERSFSRNQKVRLETIWQKQASIFSSNVAGNAFYLRLRYYPNLNKQAIKAKNK